MLSEVWVSAGPHAKDIFLIHNLEPLLGAVATRIK